MNETARIKTPANGVNQKGVRDHNERLILSVLQRNEDLPGSEVARRTGLSAQTVSVILRKLEADGLVIKGTPVKGKVGKPFVPMRLNPNGAISIGYKIGRRSSEIFVIDLLGNILFEHHIGYEIALPKDVMAFMKSSFEAAVENIGPALSEKLCGIGIAAPFEIWKWGVSDGNISEAFLSWKDVSFEAELTRFTDLPVFVVNDATAACWAEHVYGRGRDFSNYAYFFVSTFIGGGVVLGHSVFEGARGNAGAFGPLRIADRTGQPKQLLDVASIHVLETRLSAAGHDPLRIWHQPQDWSEFAAYVADWIEDTAHAIAQACVSVCAVIDFETVVIDGFLPSDIRADLVTAVRRYLPQEDSRGLVLPDIEEGQIGGVARGVGAACSPIFAQYFLNSKTLTTE